MADEKKALNLDELFGQARAVKVIWKAKTYELPHFNDMSSKQLMAFQRLQARATSLRNAGEYVTDEQAEQMAAVLDETLSLICVDFPISGLTFMEKSRVLAFYVEETTEKKMTDLVALKKVRAPRTGARSSHK